MHDATPQRPYETAQPPALEAWGPLPGLEPVQEYRVLADELQTCFPEVQPQQLDHLIAREMLCYGGHSSAVVIQAMLEASLYLAQMPVSAAQDYVRRTVAEALQQGANDDTVLGWEG